MLMILPEEYFLQLYVFLMIIYINILKSNESINSVRLHFSPPVKTVVDT